MVRNERNDNDPDPNENSIPPSEQEKTRFRLACLAAMLAMLSFVAFIFTNNPNALAGTSVLAYPLFRVIDYYFGNNKYK